MSDLTHYTASKLSELIRQGEVTALDVLEAHLAKIKKFNPAINAIVTLDEAGARRRAKQADEALDRGELWGPLHGVPMTIKDAFETQGMRTTGGYPPLSEHIPEQDATVVARLKDAGIVLMGKSNCPVLSADYRADNPIFGRTNNPWDLERTPGGSSGGAAAALATTMTPLDIGSDIAGSIRIPAHCCGVYGLKPTQYRVPLSGHIPDLPDSIRCVRHMNTIGPLSRSVEDLELVLRVISGPDDRDWETSPAGIESLNDFDPKTFRIAWTDDFNGLPVCDDTRHAISKLANMIEQQNVTVKNEFIPGFDFEQCWETWGELLMSERAALDSARAMERVKALGARPDSKVAIDRGMARGANPSMTSYTQCLARRDSFIEKTESFFQNHDALLTPVMITSAINHVPFGTAVEVNEEQVPYLFAGVAFTSPFNLTGHPAVVIPLAQSKQGLPIGLQIIGPLWSEMKLMKIATWLDTLTASFKLPAGY